MSGRLGRGQDGRRDRGAVLLLTAIALPVLILATSFAMDLGRQRVARRDMQAKADVIALDLSRLIDGGLASSINYSGALAASAARNDVPVAKITHVRWGTTNAGTGAFEACASATCYPTAVQVTAEEDVDWFFQPGKGHVVRTAVASSSASSGLTIGSFAASVNSGSGTLLNTLIGNRLNLGALGYTGLATTNVSLLGISNQLGLGSPTELLNTDVSVYDALRASAQVLQQNSANAAKVALLNQILAVPNSPLRNVNVGDVIKLDAGGEDAAAVGNVNVFDLLTAGAFIADGTSGVNIPATALSLPGTNVTGALNLIQKAQTAYGGVGTFAETAQATLDAGFTLATTTLCESTTNLLANLVGGVVNLLNLLLGVPGCGLLGLNKLISVEVKANLHISLASAKGTITRIGCGTTEALDVGVRSDLVRTDLTVSAILKAGSTTIANVPLSVHAGGDVANGAALFTLPPDQVDVFKPVNPGSGSLGLDSLQVTGLGALGSLLTPIVNPLLTTTISTLNSTIILPLSKALGVRVAGADVAPKDVVCNAVKLTG